jgi:hypothetical protein
MEIVMTAETRPIEAYVRINIAKQAKGYVHETTISLRWEPTLLDGTEFLEIVDEFAVTQGRDDGSSVTTHHRLALGRLLESADYLAREEIKRREQVDAESRP